jgi:hypothetical protein
MMTIDMLLLNVNWNTIQLDYPEKTKVKNIANKLSIIYFFAELMFVRTILVISGHFDVVILTISLNIKN